MRWLGGLAVGVLLLSGCSNGVTDIEDAVSVDNVPACRTWPIELAGDTYYEMRDEEVEHWVETHADPYGGTPQPQATAAWADLDDAHGMLYRYEDGTALYIAATGNRIYFTHEEREFDAVC